MFMPTAYTIKPSSAEQRLQDLIKQRMAPGCDRVALDQRIWDLFGEEWAVMFTDLSGFSRQVATFGIIHFLQIIYESLRVLTPVIESHDGFLLKVEADSMMIIFRQPRSALDCALEMMRTLETYNQGRPADELVLLCVGLGYGRMLRIGDHEVFGSEVNAASKLGEDTAKAREILVTENFAQSVAGKVPTGVTFDKLDETVPGAKAAFRCAYGAKG